MQTYIKNYEAEYFTFIFEMDHYHWAFICHLQCANVFSTIKEIRNETHFS
jgi:hypothetical protein